MAYEKPNAIGRSGWSEKELKILDESLRVARENGESLRPAFDRVAKETGRKASSIRNYYYTVYKKQNGESSTRTFETFTDEEVRALVSYMLRAQAEGKSVRRAALELGEFDQTRMLRYQNKYRSLVKSRPDLVREAAEKLRGEGIAVPFPKEETGFPEHAVQLDDAQSKKALAAIWQNMQRQLMQMPVRTAAPLVEALSALFTSIRRTIPQQRDLASENEALRRENIGLIRQLELVQTPVDGDALAVGKLPVVRRASHRSDMFHNTAGELAVFIPKKEEY